MDLLPLIAGLGLFLVGMKLLEEALGELAGVPFRRFLRDHADTPVRGILVGTAATAVLQSSSLVSLLILAFVGAGIMELRGALGVVMGANLGTTVTGWLVATLGFKLDLAALALVLVGAGGLGATLLPKGSKSRQTAAFVVGLGLLLLGLDYMKEGVDAFARQFDVSPFAGLNILLLALIGAAVTAVIQSSSAAMMIAISALHGGVMDLNAAAAFAVGTGVGTTVTAVIGSIGGTPDKKRVAAAHVGFNVVKALLALLLLVPMLALIRRVPGLDDPLYSLVAFHSAFNVLGIALMLPLVAPAARWLGARFRDPDAVVNRYLQRTGTEVPEAAVEAVAKEARRLLCMAIGLNRYVLRLHPPERSAWIESKDQDPAEGRRTYGQRYERLKRLEGELVEFVVSLQQRELDPEISRSLGRHLDAIRGAVISAKSVKDIRENLVEMRLALRAPVEAWIERFSNQFQHFYGVIDRLDPDQAQEVLIEELARLRRENRDFRDAMLADLYRDAGRRALSELELSTLFNVNRELHSSGKALLRALNSHLLLPQTAEVLESADA
ncbi:MAG TPA: Na/Pi symporter [Xanthomonadaceae bacterium]|nr:Na/Pi symporter [Xanthomonadaceae bacterium]